MEVDVQAANVGRQTTQIFWKILQLNFSICTQKQNKKNKKKWNANVAESSCQLQLKVNAVATFLA